MSVTANTLALTRYRVSERALADAQTIPEIVEVTSWYDGMRKAAHGLKNRQAEIEAAEFVIRAQRKLGEMILAAGKAGALAKGGGCHRDRKAPVPTLADAGVDKNLAKSARKLGRLERDEFEQRLTTWHETVSTGARITATLPASPKQPSTAKVAADSIALADWRRFSEDERRHYLDLHNFPSDSQFTQEETDSIDWAKRAWNPVTGCEHECPYCYSPDMAKRFPGLYPHGFAPAWRPFRLHAPRNTRVPEIAATDTRFRNVFTCSMADLFGRWVPREWIETVLTVVRENPQWNFLFLTKFPKRITEFAIPPNAWMGTTVDLQARVANAETAFARLVEAGHAGVRWLSVEPMLEPLKFQRLDLFHWIVMGGASRTSRTPEFRPPIPWWNDLYHAAKAAGCAVYMKSNLLGNRILELPFNAPIKTDPTVAPPVFHYLRKMAD